MDRRAHIERTLRESLAADPVHVVEAMSRIVASAEQHWRQYGHPFKVRSGRLSQDVTESVSHTAVQLAEQVEAVAIVCLTNSGTTARTIARHRPESPE